MQLEITQTTHNQVDWIVRTKILWIEIGLISGVVFTTSLLASTASTVRWQVITVLITISILIAGILAATTPLNERGHLERLPEGGALTLHKIWIPIGSRKAIDIPVDAITGFEYEVSVFQDSEEDKYPMARLWILRKSEPPLKLTGWLNPQIVDDLGNALSKASRCDYNRGNEIAVENVSE